MRKGSPMGLASGLRSGETWLKKAAAETAMKLLTLPSRALQRPPHWQGFRVTPEQSAAGRITARIPPALGSGAPREELILA